jgi:acyl carrier protein phosphodiesterase
MAMLPYMISGNWFVGYSEIAGIRQALSGMARRTPYDSKMDEATKDLSDDYLLFQNEFNRFFPELASFAKTWRIDHLQE